MNIIRLLFRARRMADALRLIAGEHCTNYTGASSCIDSPERHRVAPFGADAWCDACVARDALGGAA